MLRVYTPPNLRGFDISQVDRKAVFLAGSIEMDKATKWQDKVIEALKDKDVDIFNPRRANWDKSWEQSADNPVFFNQVTWEMNHLQMSDHKFFYFEPGTMSPISLMELGMMLGRFGAIVVCPEGFWRKGNVDIFCKRGSIPLFTSLEEGITHLKSIL